MEREEYMTRYRELLERLDIEDLSFCIRTGLEILYDRLRDDGFDCDIQLTGDMDNGSVRLFCVETNGIATANSNFQKVFRV